MRYFIFCIFSLLFFSHPLLADRNPYQVEIVTPFSQVKKGESFPIALWIQLKPKWYTYWSYPGDFGKNLKADWNLPQYITVSPKSFPRPERYLYNIGGKNYSSFIYKKEALIPFEIFINKNYLKSEASVSLQLEFFICKDICISKKETLNLNLKISDSFVTQKLYKDLFKKWEKYQPKDLNIKSHFKRKDDFLFIHFQFREYLECLDLFPNSIESFSSNYPILLHQSQDSCSFKVEKTSSSLPLISGLLSYKQQGSTFSSFFSSYEKKPFNLIWFIFMAFLGGLLLNIMPCVLPIIFIKFYNTLEVAHRPKKEIIKLNLSYAAGVILSFLALAFFIFISKKAGESIGWGFHLQSSLFVTLLSILFICMAFYLLNLFSIPLPKTSVNFQNEKMLSHFVTGILSTTAASPCTVPFMAPAVGFAFSRSIFEIFTIFFFLGLGLSFPYIFLSFFPKLFKLIPAPKKWMNRVKSLLSIPLFLTVLWFIYLIYKQLDPHLFLMTLFIFPLVILIILIQHFMKKSYFKNTIILFSIIVVSFILFFQWSLNQSIRQKRKSHDSSAVYTKGLNWRSFSLQEIEKDRENGYNVLVSIGAEWCLTCKVNERIFYDSEVQNFLKAYDTKLYHGDWTNRDPYITRFLNSYGQSGIPFYILYSGKNKTKILPSFLFKEKVLNSLEEIFKTK